jgi:hypothetical protein
MKWLLASLSVILFLTKSLAQRQDSIVARIVVVGDAGALVGQRSPVIDGIKKLVPLDNKTTVVFVGDNLYGEGLPNDQFTDYWKFRAVLDSQVSVVRNSKAKAYFIPGNHDWMNGKPGGWEAILRQQRYIDQISRDNVKFYPEGGCPGPVEVKITDDVILVVMDSQWWLHQNEKPGIESDCPQKTKEEVLTELGEILNKNDKKLVLFAFHHPFKSNGIHGGYYTLKQHIFPFTDINKKLYIPLPLIGSLYPISRGIFGDIQDLKHPIYQDMVKRVETVVKQHHYTVFLHGHEHNLQYFADSNFNVIISGSGCKRSRVQKGRSSEYVTSTLGFALIEVSKNKNVDLSFYTVAADSFGRAFYKHILNFSSPPPIKDTIARTVPLYEYRDSVLAPASVQYRKSGKVHRMLLGDNYRQEWSTPVMFKEFNIKKEKGGFTIEGRGGGKQTKSLSLVDKQGNEWALRTIDKDPEKAIPENFRGGPIQYVVQDMISASHPYAPLVVPHLAKAVGVLQASPEMFFVPDDPAFGYYRKLFANKICFLERKDPVPRGIETKSTTKIINNMLEENENVVNQRSVLKARLLDILIADFDRHMDQWKWAVTDTGIGKLYVPIAKDRDQAFFYSDGEVMNYVTRRRMPFLTGFRHKIPKINWLGFSAKDFDRMFLNRLEEKDWEETVREFNRQMTDSVISYAARKLPREIYPLTGDTIVSKLKDRREHLPKAAMTYYRFLARDVNVLGSNRQEYFDVNGTDTGTLIKVYAKEKNGDTNLLVYQRMFDPKITKEIRLYGLNGNDKFSIKGNPGIRFRLIGGRGEDTFNVDGRMKTIVYDIENAGNYISPGRRTKDRMSTDPAVNNFTLNEFQYSMKKFPQADIGFNTEDGLMIGIGFNVRTHGFRNLPYESDNKLTTLYSFFDKAYRISYRGEFNHVARGFDLLIRSDLYNPVLTNFFGLGNETKKIDSLGMHFYRARYKYLANDFQVRKRLFNNKFAISIGPSFFHYWNKFVDNDDRILGNPEALGLDSSGVYGLKTYGGARFDMDINNLNNDFYPTRGVKWNTNLLWQTGIGNTSFPLTRFQSDMTVYASLADYQRLLAVIKLGGGHIFSDKFEYFQALNLGANNYLRGFRKSRFSGSSMLYASGELRCKILDVKSAVFPGSFGVVAFDDIGRVWMRNEHSTKWHNAYGGGVYYLPFDLLSIALTVASSEEETLFNFSLGTRLSFYF